MLKGKELILATKPFAQEHRAKSWLYLLTTLGLWLGTYAGVFWFISYPLVSIAFGVVWALTSVRFFTIYHDYLHKSILQKSVIAEVIFTIYGLYSLTPVGIWKRSHDYHHSHNSKLYTSSIGSFPVVTREKFLAASRGERALYLFIRHPLAILFGYFFAFAYGMCIRSFLSNPRKHIDSLIALVLHYSVAVLVFWFLGWQGLLLGFFLPFLISHAMGAYLFYAQHNFPDSVFEEKEGWTYIGAALNSSSYMKMNPVMNWFTGNIGYHHIHHVNARIPFYRLPEVYAHFPEFQEAKTTSLHPSDIIACLRLKVWDTQSRRMIGMKELRQPMPPKTPVAPKRERVQSASR